MEVRDSVLRCWDAHPGIRVRKEYMPHWVAPLAVACQRLGVEFPRAGEALRAPVDILGVDPAGMENETLNAYILSMVHVLMSISAHQARGPGQEVEDGEA